MFRPLLHPHRCKQLVCCVCTRTCEGKPTHYDYDSLQPVKSLNRPPVAPRKIRLMKRARKYNSPETVPTQAGRRRSRVDDENSDHHQREPTLPLLSGCKRTICRQCTIENPMRYALQTRFTFGWSFLYTVPSHFTVWQDCHCVLPKPEGENILEDADMIEA